MLMRKIRKCLPPAPEEQSVGISQARTMIQYYVGQMMLDTPHSIGWILDDDMVFDSRALSYGDYSEIEA